MHDCTWELDINPNNGDVRTAMLAAASVLYVDCVHMPAENKMMWRLHHQGQKPGQNYTTEWCYLEAHLLGENNLSMSSAAVHSLVYFAIRGFKDA